MHGRAHVTPIARPEGDARGAKVMIADLRGAIELRLAGLISGPAKVPITLERAMRHALLAPGKRVRPLLTMLTAAEFGADPLRALDAGCAVELVHTASLILDDLPCMDDAKTRRGQPATHSAFGEATAVLAAIAMLTRAFGILSEMEGVSAAARIDLTTFLSNASGADGLAAGQERDLKDRRVGDSVGKIDDINDQKTGALFIASVQMGGRIADVSCEVMEALLAMGHEIGYAFQTLDDMIDLSRSAGEAGKDTGKDAGKGTIAAVMGLDHARGEVQRHMALAHTAIEPFASPNGPLRGFVSAMFAQAATGAEREMATKADTGSPTPR